MAGPPGRVMAVAPATGLPARAEEAAAEEEVEVARPGPAEAAVVAGPPVTGWPAMAREGTETAAAPGAIARTPAPTKRRREEHPLTDPESV